MVNSREKGKKGELEFSHFLQGRGFEARRGRQFSGGDDSPDVVHNIPGVHFEVKRAQVLRLDDWMAQARADAGTDKKPVIAWRKNHGEWMAVLSMEDFLAFMRDRFGLTMAPGREAA